jgi:hypothetical protein
VPRASTPRGAGFFFRQPIPRGPPLARRQSPQTFEKRRRERDKKLKKETKQLDRIWRNAEKRDAKLQATDPEAYQRMLEQQKLDEQSYYSNGGESPQSA